MIVEHLQKFFQRFTGEIPNRSNGGNLYVKCPLAKWTHEKGHDNRPSMSVRIANSRSVCYCWGCKFKGTLVHLVKEVGKYEDIYEQLYIDLINSYETDSFKNFTDGCYFEVDDIFNPKPLVQVYNESLLDTFRPLNDHYRSVSFETTRDFCLMYDRQEDRIVFPVRNISGELAGAVGRACNPDAFVKYKNYWNFKKGRVLFGEQFVQNDTCIIVEGPYDVLCVYDAVKGLGYDVLGLLGAHPSEEHIEKLLTWYTRCIIFTDNDRAGLEAASKLVKGLGGSIEVEYLVYGSFAQKDPGDCVGKIPEYISGRTLKVKGEL